MERSASRACPRLRRSALTRRGSSESSPCSFCERRAWTAASTSHNRIVRSSSGNAFTPLAIVDMANERAARRPTSATTRWSSLCFQKRPATDPNTTDTSARNEAITELALSCAAPLGFLGTVRLRFPAASDSSARRRTCSSSRCRCASRSSSCALWRARSSSRRRTLASTTSRSSAFNLFFVVFAPGERLVHAQTAIQGGRSRASRPTPRQPASGADARAGPPGPDRATRAAWASPGSAPRGRRRRCPPR